MKIITTMVEEELFEGSNQYGNKVSIDMRKGPDKVGQSPVEILQSALAACAGVDIVAMLKKRKKQVTAFSVEVESIRKESAPRWLTDIHCKYIVTSPDVNEEELEKVSRLAVEKYCSVASSLKSRITFSIQVIR
ncbi:MAG: OsmC family protein [Chryseolinea sp.]